MKKVLSLCVAVLCLVACGGKEMSLFNKAQGYANKKQYNKAIQIYTQIIKNNPQSEIAYANRGLMYELLDTKNAEELKKNRGYAERDYERAIGLSYQQPEIFNNLAALYIDEGRNYDAVQLLNQALYLRPDYFLALVNRAIAKSKQGNMGAALLDFEKAEKLDSQSPLLYLNRGLAYYAGGYYMGAAENFSMLMDLQPQNARAYTERGRAFVKMDHYQNAMDDFQLAIAIRPDYAMPYYYASELLFLRGSIDEAIAYAQRAKELSPNTAFIYDTIGDMLALSSPVEATQHYLAARRLDPVHADKYQNKIRMMTSENGRKRVVANRLIDIEKK